MKILRKIKRKLVKLIPFTRSETILKRWVYKLTIEQVSLIFEIGDLSCFKFNRKRRFKDFIIEYNELFNSGGNKKQLNIDRFYLKLYTNHIKLRAMFEALTIGDAENSKKEFEILFKKKYKDIGDIDVLLKEYERISNKMEIIRLPIKENELSFSQLVIIVETSRGIAIEQNTKLYRFYEMYKIELDKWHKT